MSFSMLSWLIKSFHFKGSEELALLLSPPLCLCVLVKDRQLKRCTAKRAVTKMRVWERGWHTQVSFVRVIKDVPFSLFDGGDSSTFCRRGLMTDLKTTAKGRKHMHTHGYVTHALAHACIQTHSITGMFLWELVNLEVGCHQFTLDSPWQ